MPVPHHLTEPGRPRHRRENDFVKNCRMYPTHWLISIQVLGAGLAFGAWHGLSPNSLFLAALGTYWGHLYAQTRNVLVPVSMHAVWNAFTLGVGACVVSGGG